MVLATKWSDFFPSQKEDNIVTPAQPEHELRYYVTVQKYRDGRPYEKPVRLAREILFEKDYRIRLTVSSPESGYLYILNEGPDSTVANPNLNTLFPSPETLAGSAHLAPGQEIQFPSNGFLLFDAQKGTEKLWLVWSQEALPNFEALKKWVNDKDHGTVKDADQARSILTELQKYSAASEEPKKDDVNNLTILKGKGKVFARQIRLEHD